MNFILKFFVHILIWIYASSCDFVRWFKTSLTLKYITQTYEYNGDTVNDGLIGRNPPVLNISPTVCVAAVRRRRFLSLAVTNCNMARPKHRLRSSSLSEDAENLFEMQRQHSTKAFDYISRALQIDESAQGKHS